MQIRRTFDEVYFSPWTIRGPMLDPDGSGAYIIEIEELPGFIVAGETEKEVLNEFGPALRAHLGAYIESGKPVPAATGKVGWMPQPLKVTIQPEPQIKQTIVNPGFALA